MSHAEYRWKAGPPMPVDAETAQKELDRLRASARRRGKELTAREVVQAARDARNPLHPCFCWDDAKAADRFRVIQAGRLIRRIEVVIVREKRESKPVTININTVHPERGRGYMDAREAVNDKGAYATLLEEARLQLQALRRRYNHLRELPELVREIFFDGPEAAA